MRFKRLRNVRTSKLGLFSRVKPAIFDLLLALCIAAYLGVAYVAVQVSMQQTVVASLKQISGGNQGSCFFFSPGLV